ncbi:ABC transporter permease [Caldinitratiruptor microaerophilus]|uniref:ABC transporter permease n=1 Tax=Caldinitratiruptor microaerophilus TaxID=671077 RepID=A0AA35CJN8_9FIRM|nr:ABC transporter permease [Caldinitratiruptor microaerophilus]BDG59709.1 ABC transporter permease [Caldinitratiruptor microaerophilus]
MKTSWRLIILEALTPLVAILFASLVGSVILAGIGKNPVAVYAGMFRFSFQRFDSVAAILFRSTPLIFSGLAVALGFRAGLFNIGVEGQYFIGAMLAAWAGFGLRGLPAAVHLPLVIALGMAGGALWALLPIWLKVRRGVHEVITTIMMNYIAYSLVHYFVADLYMDRGQKLFMGLGSPQVRTPHIAESARMPTLHGLLAGLGVELPRHVYLNWFFPLALLLAVGFYYLLWRTPFGYEVRAVGLGADAAEAAGIDTRRVLLRTFLLSGAVAGLTGLSPLLSYIGYLDIDFPKNYGFNGIAVALLGKNHPLGIVLSALLFGFLDRGAEGVQALQGVPMDAIAIIQGVMVLSIVVAVELMTRYVRRQQKKEAVS